MKQKGLVSKFLRLMLIMALVLGLLPGMGVNVQALNSTDKLKNPATVTETATVMRGGNTVDLASNVTTNGAEGEISFAISNDANGCSLSESIFTSGETTGIVTVKVTIAEDDMYQALEAKISVTITNKNVQTITAEDVTAVFGDTDKKVVASTDGDGALSYAIKEGSEEYIDVDSSTGILTIKSVPADEKTYVTVTAAETVTFEQATKDVAVIISQIDEENDFTIKHDQTEETKELSDSLENSLLMTTYTDPHTHAEGEEMFTKWTATDSLPNVAGNYYLVNNVTLPSTGMGWTVPVGETNLCLNGKTISSEANGFATINVGNMSSSATLNLYDCVETGIITHGSTAVGKGIVVYANSIFNMYGGTVTGNTGGGLSNRGTFNLIDGNIIGNTTSGNGGGVELEGGTFNMSGGTISRNSAKLGGGIYIGPGTPSGVTADISGGSIINNTCTDNGGGIYKVWYGLSLSGNPVISGNKKDSEDNNLYLENKFYFQIKGNLTNETPIGISMETPDVFTKDLYKHEGGAAKFTSEMGGYEVISYGPKNQKEAKLVTTERITVNLDWNGRYISQPSTYSLRKGDSFTDALFEAQDPEQYYDDLFPTFTEGEKVYKVSGWYEDPNCINEWDLDDSIESNKTFYAKWGEVIAEASLTLSLPLCGVSTTTSKSQEMWDLRTQTNRPVATVPSGVGYRVVEYPGSIPAVFWINGLNQYEPYEGTFIGNTQYYVLCALESIEKPFAENVTIKVNGETIPRENLRILGEQIMIFVPLTAIHDWSGEKTVKTEPTITTEGKYTVKCKNNDTCHGSTEESIPKVTYALTDKTSSWIKGSSSTADFRFVRSFENGEHTAYKMLKEVQVDNKKITDYSTTEGSVIVKLKPSYLESLSVGKHELKAIFTDDGIVTTSFTIKAKESSDGGSTLAKKTDNVVTCQMAGFPANYAWNEAAKACQPGYIDAGGNFHPYKTVVRRSSPNTSDNGNLTMYAMAMFLMTFVAYITAKKLTEDSRA